MNRLNCSKITIICILFNLRDFLRVECDNKNIENVMIEIYVTQKLGTPDVNNYKFSNTTKWHMSVTQVVKL